MRNNKFVLVCAFASLAIMAWAGAQAASSMQAEPTSVAVANVQKIFNNLKQRQSLENKAKAHLKGLESQQNSKKQSIKTLQDQLGVLQPGSKAYSQKQSQLEKEAIGYKVWLNYQKKKISRDSALKVEALYRKVVASVQQVAQNQGYDIVLYADRSPEFHYSNKNQLSAEIRMRQVLWASDSVDITDQVVQSMNNHYTNSGS